MSDEWRPDPDGRPQEQTMRAVVTGSRTWVDEETIAAWLHILSARHGAHVRVAHGACHLGGADIIADAVAHQLGFDVARYPVDHAIDGEWPEAGPRRNVRMLRAEKPQRVLAFRDRVDWRGTKNCCEEAWKLGIPYTVIAPGSRP